jgi:hypothetical protein
MSNLYRILNNKLRKNTSDIISIKLIEFYEDMKKLETDPKRGGKQATLILQTTNDIELLEK